jgi:uncharacterized protein (TIGR04141 family)
MIDADHSWSRTVRAGYACVSNLHVRLFAGRKSAIWLACNRSTGAHLVSKLNTFCLYLAKPGVANFGDLLTANAHGLLESGVAKATSASTFADGAILHTFPGFPNIPKWVPLLQTSFSVPDRLFSQSPCALVAFKKDGNIFALAFSYAHVYLDDAKTEANFGLKAAVNAVSDERLRSVERSNIGAAIPDFAQAAGLRDLRTFGFDDALDLIRKVSGRAADNDFADMVTGARSLRFTKKSELAEIPDAAAEAVDLFNATAYRKTGFRIIDFLSPVLDPVIESELARKRALLIRGGDVGDVASPCGGSPILRLVLNLPHGFVRGCHANAI